MPVLDGWAVVKYLREHPAWLDGNRVVLMSAGRTLSEVHLPTLRDVMHAIVPKPFELETLMEVVLQFAAGHETNQG